MSSFQNLYIEQIICSFIRFYLEDNDPVEGGQIRGPNLRRNPGLRLRGLWSADPIGQDSAPSNVYPQDVGMGMYGPCNRHRCECEIRARARTTLGPPPQPINDFSDKKLCICCVVVFLSSSLDSTFGCVFQEFRHFWGKVQFFKMF